MKSGKAAGPLGIVVEMIKAAGDTGATMIRDLATAIIRDGKVPTDWVQVSLSALSIYLFIIPNPLPSIIGMFACAWCVSKKL